VSANPCLRDLLFGQLQPRLLPPSHSCPGYFPTTRFSRSTSGLP
jgi:hypothetical protein